MFEDLKKSLHGDLYDDKITKILYSTDASVYKEEPLAVARPKDKHDIKTLIDFANTHGVTLIPRAAGTSLAGQVVGKGLVVDISKYFTNILEFNEKERWVRVEPGVNLEELNNYLKDYNLQFGPETSTANRCLIGGMLGNNACGLHSLVYGSTRDHTLSVKAFLSNGDEVEFMNLSKEAFQEKCKGNSFESKLYQNTRDILSDKENQEEIKKHYPDPSLKRRNTGYAIDLLMESEPFTPGGGPFNFCKLIAGSEGTLAFVTEIKLNLIPLPPPEKAVIPVHLDSVKDALKGNLVALKHQPQAIELMDDKILQLTKDNFEQRKNRFFVKGDPGALLIVEFVAATRDELMAKSEALEKDMKANGYGYHFPVLFDDDIKKVWNLRKAGLGILSNLPGDAKPVSVIEDTSVVPEVLPDYIEEFNAIIKKYNLECVYYAHIATGELHLRPILNLKDKKDVALFHNLCEEIAKLVKKYKGTLSGEHGDGRLRGEFIPLMVGEKNYQLLRKIKATWDPDNVFNAEKIIDTPPMTSHLRYEPGEPVHEIETIFDFSNSQGIVRAAEKCNGSGDCRKTEKIGGTMCPSYMATRDENHVTRARANVLREFLTHSQKKNPFDHKEIYEIMDLCLSCKACKSECPSNVDVAKLKAEFLQHYYDAHGVPVRSWLVGNISKIHALGAVLPSVMNFFMGNKFFVKPVMKMIGFDPRRNMPLLYKTTLKKWVKKYIKTLEPQSSPKKTVYLFNDEFTNFLDTGIGIKAIQTLSKLGYKVVLPKHVQSGRAYLSKGLIRKARAIATKNINFLKDKISEHTPLIGLEPSAILAFRDEYPDLVDKALQEDANRIAENTLLFDEFIKQEIDKENITKSQFTNEERAVLLHGHCQQKAVASTSTTLFMLSFPENYTAEEIPSGCCGMAGSFGFEKEHYEVSMKIGEMVLFPAVREAPEDTIISAPGTSCRQQIKDGTGREAKHPVEVLHEALK